MRKCLHPLAKSATNSILFCHMPGPVTSPNSYIANLPSGSYLRVGSLPGSPAAARTAIHRAAKRAELASVSRGLYYKGTKTRYGMTTPPPEDVALELLGRVGVGPAGVSAARAFGLTTQIPAMSELAAAGPVSTKIRNVVVHKRNNMSRRGLNYTEIALLELLRDWRHTSEADWSELAAAVRAKVADGKIRPRKVLSALPSEHHRSVAEATTALLEPAAQ